MTDIGLTHVALPARDLDRTIAFYKKYADMEVVHERQAEGGGARVAWLSDKTRPFVIVFLETDDIAHPLGPFSHLGVGLASRAAVDERVAWARADGLEIKGPHDSGPPVGYWVFLRDPDGHTLELTHGQEVHLTVAQAAGATGAT
jgi:catechol 2,3-dioxygenase-like lactoylglutathione lyase family enzyme